MSGHSGRSAGSSGSRNRRRGGGGGGSASGSGGSRRARAKRTAEPERPAGWYVAKMDGWGWSETAIKAIGILVGILSLAFSGFSNAEREAGDFPTGTVVTHGLMTLSYVVAIFDRIMDKEIIGMIFVVLNNAGHWCVMAGLMTKNGIALSAPSVALTFMFWVFFLIGDLVKIGFIYTHKEFNVRGAPRWVLYLLTGVIVVLEILSIILAAVEA